MHCDSKTTRRARKNKTHSFSAAAAAAAAPYLIQVFFTKYVRAYIRICFLLQSARELTHIIVSSQVQTARIPKCVLLLLLPSSPPQQLIHHFFLLYIHEYKHTYASTHMSISRCNIFLVHVRRGGAAAAAAGYLLRARIAAQQIL